MRHSLFVDLDSALCDRKRRDSYTRDVVVGRWKKKLVLTDLRIEDGISDSAPNTQPSPILTRSSKAKEANL